MLTGRDRSRAHLSRRIDGSRLLLAVGLLAIAQFAIRDSLASAIAKALPLQAVSLAPWNGRIAASAAETIFNAAPVVDGDAPAAKLSVRAILSDPTAVKAFNVLGLQAQLRQDTLTARRIFTQSRNLSRRELPSQLWAIEEAVSRGDIAAALANYEIVLRSSRQGAEILYPILGSALDEPLVRSELLKLYAAQPNWGPDFIRYAARNTNANPRSTYAFFKEGTGELPIKRVDKDALVGSLLKAGENDLAWELYTALNPGASRSSSRDVYFKKASEMGTPLDWQAEEIAPIDFPRGGGIALSIPPATAGTLIYQQMLLPPGAYEVSVSFKDLTARQIDRPYAKVTCGDGRELSALDLGVKGKDGTVSASFAVPVACPVQRLELIARNTDRMEGVSGVINSVRVSSKGSGSS